MKLQKTVNFLVLLGVLAAFGMGCEPYHHDHVGVGIDVHSDNHGDHHDKDDHHDDDKH